MYFTADICYYVDIALYLATDFNRESKLVFRWNSMALSASISPFIRVVSIYDLFYHFGDCRSGCFSGNTYHFLRRA